MRLAHPNRESEESYRALKVQAALTDRTMSEMVDEAVEEWLSDQHAE